MAETTKTLGWVPASMTYEEAEGLVEANGKKYLWQPQEPVPIEEYRRRELLSVMKSEYAHGQPYPLIHRTDDKGEPMPGATHEHNVISHDLGGELYIALRGGGCSAYNSDMGVFIPATGRSYYPDATVVCGEPRLSDQTRHAAVVNPTLIVEVLSESTEQKDRGEKFEAYRTLGSLREYALVAQDRRRVEVFRRREEDGRWVLYEYGAGEDAVELASVGARIEMSALYARVSFKAA